MKKLLILLVVIIIVVLGFNYFLSPFRPVSNDRTIKTFIVPENSFQDPLVMQDLEGKGFVRSFWAVDLILTIKGKHDKISPGGYYLSKNMDAFQIVGKMTGQAPDLRWFSFAEGLRKEQIGERLKKALGWTNEELDKWNNIYTAMQFDYFEGVYFPDTYLIPVKENGLEIAKRMINRFNEKVGGDIVGFAKKNILWTTGLKIASIIQREAGGQEDMPIIAGVIWNRLEKNQALQMDATIQYAKGKVGDKWWSVVTGDDVKNIDSLYNSYQHKGLPPHPISNPGLDAINAALNPEETDCLYYLHDHSRQIHCSATYQEHLDNIEKYLN